MELQLKKTICILLALMLAFGPLAEGILPVFARNTENELAPNGQTWEEAYPNGAFIFKESYLYSKEGDDTVAIAVYRMGGRDSRAVANLAITPATPEGNRANAAGLKDFEIISPEDVEIDWGNEYDTVFADLVFEEGEYVKSLEIRAIDDELSEPEEFFIVTIYGAEDAEFLEDGNRFTMCIKDNDPYVKSYVSFAEKRTSFDKSEGSAILEVVRTGGIQYVFSVDYETISGTAIAGVDFAETSGTLLFNCGEERATIEIPLINDNNEDESMDISFWVKLSNPKGGDIVEDGREAEVYLYNTAKEDAIMNIATLVTDSEGIDISGKTVISDDAIISNNEEITVVPESKESTPLVETAPKASKGGIQPMAIVDSKAWKFAPNQGEWKQYTNLSGIHKDSKGNEDADYYYDLYNYDKWSGSISSEGSLGFSIGDESNKRWYIFAGENRDPRGYMIMKDADLDGLYEYYKSMAGAVHMKFDWGQVGTKNHGQVILSNNDSPVSQLDGSSVESVEGSGWSIFYSNQENDSYPELARQDFKAILSGNINHVYYDRPALFLKDNSWGENTHFNIWVDSLYLERAAINNLRYEVVCKDGDTYLTANTNKVLEEIKPEITLVDGGTDSAGKLYVGSELKLDLPATAGAFRISGVELRKKDGGNWRTINSGTLGADNKTGSIKLRSKSDSKVQRVRDISSLNADSDEYSLYVEMERNQRILLDYSPNVLPQDIAGGETDENYIIRARRKGERIAYQPDRGYDVRGVPFGMPVLVDGKLTNTYIYNDVTDATIFDFRLKNGEAIAYDGDMYYGPVPIKVEDYTEKEIFMIFYDSESMSREQEVRISGIEAAEMYIDNNGNGAVDEGDAMVGYLNDDRYVNSFFEREGGKQKLLKYDYVKLPRKINTTPADDTSIRYDMKASFVTTAVSDAELAKYTDEMKTYREIETRDTKVPIYGVESMKGSITVPLGGDLNQPVYDKSTEKWDWTPDFEGNLKTSFANPAQIKEAEKETVAGPKVISGEDEINDYIGSFRNSDQIVL